MAPEGSEAERSAPAGTTINFERWAGGDHVRKYANRTLQPVEVMLLVRYREALSGRVLEIGCGGGRLSGYLAEISSDLHGIDVSPAMIAHCRRLLPGASFEVGDMRDLGAHPDASIDVVFAPVNVLDAVDDSDRHRTLDEWRRVLVPGGLLIMSSHNLAFAPQVLGPLPDALARLRSREWPALARSLWGMPRGVVNRRRMRKLESVAADHSMLNDRAHEFSLLHYYIGAEQQQRQLAEHGFEPLECLDLDGVRLQPGDQRPDCAQLHYVAVRPAAGRPQ